MKLTPRMRAALTDAKHRPLRRVHAPGPGKPAWPAHPASLAALVRHGLLEQGEARDKHANKVTTWTLTDAGRRELEPRHVFIEERDTWMARTGSGSDWTKDPGRRMDDAPRMQQASPAWRRRAEAARLGDQDRQSLARHLAQQAKAA